MWKELDEYVSNSDTLNFLNITDTRFSVNGKVGHLWIEGVVLKEETDKYRFLGNITYGRDSLVGEELVKVDKVVENQKVIIRILNDMIDSMKSINNTIKVHQDHFNG
jgi:hypothetical protein